MHLTIIWSILGVILANIAVWLVAYSTASDWCDEKWRIIDSNVRVIEFNMAVILACLLGYIIRTLCV